jgi:uncharacterized protein YjeT (DUF2065 family)
MSKLIEVMPTNSLRTVGMVFAALGFIIVWFWKS